MPEMLFLFDRPEAVAAWSAIDDRVMGGVSRSALRFDPAGHAVFSGQVSPDNNGGFASVRASVSTPLTTDIDAIELVVRGDGHSYKLNLRTDRGFDGVNYQAAFAPPAGQWATLRLTIVAGSLIPHKSGVVKRRRRVGAGGAVNGTRAARVGPRCAGGRGSIRTTDRRTAARPA